MQLEVCVPLSSRGGIHLFLLLQQGTEWWGAGSSVLQSHDAVLYLSKEVESTAIPEVCKGEGDGKEELPTQIP